MLRKDIGVDRPQRWDVPFGEEMTPGHVERLLKSPPFSEMAAARFPASCPLDGILLNDTRIVRYQRGDIVVREGDYGNSAFLVLSGKVRVALQSLPAAWLGRATQRVNRAWNTLRQIFLRPVFPEVRELKSAADTALGQRTAGDAVRIFLQDVPGVLDQYRSLTLGAGEIFGEIAALSRSPRTATVFVEDEALLLEIRWQGLRDLMRHDPALQEHVHQLYRKNSLESHLRETPWLNKLQNDALREVARATEFATFGDFQWRLPEAEVANLPAAERIRHEPVIAEEGQVPSHLTLVRSGFTRVSTRFGDGHRTLSYLGKGGVFGLPELVAQWRQHKPVALKRSLRAVGYVDVLRIPLPVLERHLFPTLSSKEVRTLLTQLAPPDASSIRAALLPRRANSWLPILSPSPAPAATSSPATSLPATSPPATSPPAAQPRAGEASTASSLGSELTAAAGASGLAPVTEPGTSLAAGVETGLLEFLGERHFINGTQTMVIDLDRCTRCDDCVRACAATHDNNPRFVREGPRYDNFMIAHACMHCVDPVCMIGCPTGAIARDEATGTIKINDPTCVGCATCANSCPYQNIKMVEIRNPRGEWIVDSQTAQPLKKATKCDLCSDLWGGPACQRACPHDALIRIDTGNTEQLKKWIW